MRLSPALLAFTLVVTACRSPAADAQRSGQVRYDGRTLEEWWQLRRGADADDERQANVAMRMAGPAAVPFLAAKAASHDLGDMIGGSVALESLCTNAVPAMEAARSEYPSAALDAAIKRVKSSTSTSNAVRFGTCTPGGEPVRPGERGE